MITVPATEFSKNFGHYREVVQTDIVAVTSHNRVTGYFVSRAEYEQLMRIKTESTKAFADEELSESTIRAIAASRMDSRHDDLNDLLRG